MANAATNGGSNTDNKSDVTNDEQKTSEDQNASVNSDVTDDKANEDKSNDEQVADKSNDEADAVDENSEAFKKAVQAKVSAVIADRLSREENKTARAQSEVETLRTEKDEALAELETVKSAQADMELELVQHQVALNAGVSLALVRSLKGATADELNASLAAVSQQKPAPVGFQGKQFSESSPLDLLRKSLSESYSR